MQGRSLGRNGSRTRGTLAVAVLLAVASLCAPAALAHEVPHAHLSDIPPLHGRALRDERRLRALETKVLGAEHAAEHARLRAYERSPRYRAALRRAAGRAKAVARRYARLTAADPLDRKGRWTDQFDIPVFAINSIMLPTGKVLWFAYPYNPDRGDKTKSNYANAWLWDPAKGTGPGAFKQVDPPIDPATGKPVNIWCAGNSLLADGQVLVTGGNLKYLTANNSYEGLDQVYTFDPFSETWTRQPNMNHGRWYPSQLLMPDGRTFIMGGLDETGNATKNADLELFNPPATRGGQGSISFLGPEGLLNTPGMPPIGDYYPHLFWMPNGRGLVAGPYTNDSWWFDAPADPSTFGTSSWTDITNSGQSRVWGTAVLVPGGPDGAHQVVQLGGSEAPITGDDPATASAEVFDTTTNSWSPHAQGDTFALNEPRSHANTVLLPDGSMVEVGGGLGSVSGTGPNGAPGQWAAEDAQKQIELWDPSTQKWRLGPAQREFRTYHSTAVLLPDGRVVSAGDDYNGRFAKPEDNFIHDSAEIYEPPYLFDGDQPAPRPELTAAPQQIAPGQSFDISADPTRPAPARAVLMGPGAATHAVDMNQRYVPLQVTGQGPGRLSVKAPSLNVALPGYYMLFVLDAAGTPSCAAWVRVAPGTPGAGTTSGACPVAPSSTPPPSQGSPPAAQPPAAKKATKPKVRVRLVRRSGKRRVRVTVGRWTKSKVRLRIVLRDRRRHTVRRFAVTVRTGRTTTLKARVPARVRSASASVR